jgi:hypothetical protein
MATRMKLVTLGCVLVSVVGVGCSSTTQERTTGGLVGGSGGTLVGGSGGMPLGGSGGSLLGGSGGSLLGGSGGSLLGGSGGVAGCGTIADGSFENGMDATAWTASSVNFPSPICDTTCNPTGMTYSAYDGLWWAWFGGYISGTETSSVSQSVVIPVGSTVLRFYFSVPQCDSARDYLELRIDGTTLWSATGADSACGSISYSPQNVPIAAYADGGSHLVEFYSQTFAANQDATHFFVDLVTIPCG